MRRTVEERHLVLRPELHLVRSVERRPGREPRARAIVNVTAERLLGCLERTVALHGAVEIWRADPAGRGCWRTH